jgi:hypothetical protein
MSLSTGYSRNCSGRMEFLAPTTRPPVAAFPPSLTEPCVGQPVGVLLLEGYQLGIQTRQMRRESHIRPHGSATSKESAEYEPHCNEMPREAGAPRHPKGPQHPFPSKNSYDGTKGSSSPNGCCMPLLRHSCVVHHYYSNKSSQHAHEHEEVITDELVSH